MTVIRIKQVDAFTDVPFGGNPAGVVTNAEGLDEGQMQKVAREMNLSETAFVTPSDKADFRQFLDRLGYTHVDESANPANRMFLGR